VARGRSGVRVPYSPRRVHSKLLVHVGIIVIVLLDVSSKLRDISLMAEQQLPKLWLRVRIPYVPHKYTARNQK
jgi:hypothetical protein